MADTATFIDDNLSWRNPCAVDYMRAAKAMSGSAGADGWSGDELAVLPLPVWVKSLLLLLLFTCKPVTSGNKACKIYFEQSDAVRNKAAATGSEI